MFITIAGNYFEQGTLILATVNVRGLTVIPLLENRI